jgi:hypothetical protein
MKRIGSEIDWTEYRKLPDVTEVDFLFPITDPAGSHTVRRWLKCECLH